MRLGLVLPFLAIVGLLGQAESRASVVLYDATLGDRPGDQSWLLYADNTFLPGTSVSQSAIPGVGTRLQSNLLGAGGYSNVNPITGALKNPEFPGLDRSIGFELEFELQVNSESHSRSDRAGFSVIALAGDGLGIELGFWEDEIWTQDDEPIFTHAEGTGFDTTASLTSYALRIQGEGYSLLADGLEILSGSLRDYSAFGAPPYTLGNFLFFGDNTTSAAGDVTLGRISLAVVPEPGSLGLAAIGIAGGMLGVRSVSTRRGRPARP
jgi:hypothetical protein